MKPTDFSQLISSYLAEPQASLLSGIIFGINLKVSKVFYQELRTVGLLHLVVLSGMNISLLSALITQATLKFGKLSSLLITVFCVVVFIVFVGFQAPLIRAGFVSIFTSVGIIFGRKYVNLLALFFAFLFTAAVFPQWLNTISFQLSYGATIGLLLFSNLSQRNYFFDEIYTSLAAQIFTAPIIFYYFKEISLVAILANVLVSWTVVPLMILGFITIILGKISYSLGWIPAQLCYGLLTYIVFVVEQLAKIPFALIKFHE